jgi:hypothetical protein
MRRVLAGGILSMLLLATPALAATHDDPDDTTGRLDLRQVTRTFTNGPSAPPFVHMQASTYDRWTLRQCRDAEGGACSFTFVFDSRKGPGTDFVAVWHAREDGPECGVFNVRTNRLVAEGVAAKYGRSAFCSFEKRILHATHPVRWSVRSFWEFIDDAAPDRAWF